MKFIVGKQKGAKNKKGSKKKDREGESGKEENQKYSKNFSPSFAVFRVDSDDILDKSRFSRESAPEVHHELLVDVLRLY